MPAKRSYKSKFTFGYYFVFIVTVLLTAGHLFAAERPTIPVEPRYRIFALKHISVEQAKTFISQAGLGTASQLPAANMILLTAQPSQLRKAGAILQLVDSKAPYVMKAILPASAAQDLPSVDETAKEFDNMLIGSFSNPPAGVGKDKAIIDVHDGSVVVISPVDKLNEIIGALKKHDSKGVFGKLQKTEPVPPKDESIATQQPGQAPGVTGKPEPEANQIADAKLERLKRELEKLKTRNGNGGFSSKTSKAEIDTEENALFGKLLNGLDEAEKKEADKKQVEPNQPSLIEPEPTEPLTKPLEEPKKAVITTKPMAEKIVAKAKPEPEVALQQEVVDIEEPNQVAAVEQQEPNATTTVIEPTNKVDSYRPELSGIVDETLTLNLPSKINIIDLLDLVGKYLNLNYMYDPADITGLKGEVTLVLQGPIKVSELYPLAESVLRFKGFVMTRRINHITIVPIAKVNEIDAPIIDPDKPGIQAGDVIITQIFRLKHVDTASAQNLLNGMKLGLSFSPVADLGILIISEYAYRMGRIERLVQMIDVPGDKKVFRFRALEYTTAGTLATKVKALAEQLGTVSVTVAATTTTTPARRPTTPTRPGTRTPTPTRPPARTTTPAAAAKKEDAVYLDADERTNRILMIGLEEQLTVVDELIDTLDVEQKDLRTLKLYEIQHVDAEEVRIKLEELGIISAGRRTTGRTSTRTTSARTTTPARTTTSTRTPAPPRTTTPTSTAAIEEPLAEEPQVVIIEPTNSLLVNATAEQHIQIATIIGYVDSTQEDAANPYVIYPLENQDPEVLAGVLEKLIQETITEQTGGDSKVVRTTTRKKIEEDIFIVADAETYSLIVYASKKNQQWIKSLIEELDQYRPQVLIDVTLVQITKDDVFNFDLEFLSSIPDMSYVSGQTSVTSNIFDLLMAPESDRNQFIEGQSLKGDFKGFYGDEKINALITAVQTKNYGRVMARPKLLVNDNQEGEIKTIDTTYVELKEPSYIGVENPQLTEKVSWQDYSAGITLTIKPHISTGDMLRLEITLNRSGFSEKPTGERPPDKADADIVTTVTVPDRSTIILGGMEKIEHSKGGKKIPFLGDLPLIGGAFRSVGRSEGHDKLYVFVKAHILRPGDEVGLDDLKQVSRVNRARFEKLEKEMGEYEDWPGIKSTPMDPERILEADEDDEVLLNSPRIIKRDTRKKAVELDYIKKIQSKEPKQILERNGAISLKNGQALDRSGIEIKEGTDLPAEKPKPLHPMQLLEFE